MSAEVSVHSCRGGAVGRVAGAAPCLFPPNFCLLWHQNPLDLGTALNLPSLSSLFSRLCQGLPGLHGGRARPL